MACLADQHTDPIFALRPGSFLLCASALYCLLILLSRFLSLVLVSPSTPRTQLRCFFCASVPWNMFSMAFSLPFSSAVWVFDVVSVVWFAGWALLLGTTCFVDPRLQARQSYWPRAGRCSSMLLRLQDACMPACARASQIIGPSRFR